MKSQKRKFKKTSDFYLFLLNYYLYRLNILSSSNLKLKTLIYKILIKSKIIIIYSRIQKLTNDRKNLKS